MKLSLERRIHAGFAASIGLLLVASVSTWWSGQRSAAEFRELAHHHHVQHLLNHTREAIVRAQAECRGFLITGDDKYHESFTQACRAAESMLAEAHTLTRKDAFLHERLAKLTTLVHAKVEAMEEGVALRRSGTPAEVRQFVASGRGEELMASIRTIVTELDAIEDARLDEQFTGTKAWAAYSGMIGLIGTVVALVLVAIAELTVRRDRRKRELAESERDRIFNVCPDILCVAGPDGYMKRVSPAALTILGWTPEEIMARPFLEFIHSDDRAETQRRIERVAATGVGLLNYAVRCRRKDGGWRWLSWKSIAQPGGLIFATGRDVTEFRAATEDQRRLAAIVKSSDDAIVSIDAAGIITSWNGAAERLLGYSAREAVGLGVQMLEPPARNHEQSAILDRLRRGEHVHDVETVRLHRDGRAIEVSATISALRTETGEFAGASAILRDISARKHIEEALRRSEESLAITLRSIGDAVLATDTAGHVTRLNPVAEKLTGWSEGEARGRPVKDVFRIIHEHTRESADLAVDQVLTSGQIHGIADDAVLIARDGTERPIADSAAPIRSASGRVLGVVLVFRDVTEERRTQAAVRDSEHRLRVLNEELERRVEERTAALRDERLRYQMLFEQSPIGVTLVDPVTRHFIDFNTTAHRQLGYTREEFARLEIADIDSRETANEVRDRIATIALAERQQFETRHRARNGELRDTVVSVQMIESGGRPILYCLCEDITDRRRAERLAQRAQRLESLGTLAGGIAHDLNNALAPISMGLELLATQSPPDPRTLDLFRTSVKRGADMVRQLLTFARGADGERVSIAPKQLLREMQAIVQATFPKNIELEVHYPSDGPPVIGDPTQLHQILLNLSVNARDAMPDGGTLTLDTGCLDVDEVFAASVPDARPGQYVFLRVRDTGTGIPPGLLDRIFEPFFTTKGPDKGTGLGLSTVMGIVRGHRGFLQVASEPGNGATFTVYLPAHPSAAANGTSPPPSPRTAGAGQLILFVDDEPALREIARVVLRRLNFQVATARDGLDALMVATERRKELQAVITDLHMPHMDGPTFVRALRRMAPAVPIAISTGRADDEAIREMQALGVKLRLDKPFTQSQLADLLGELLRANA